MDLSTITDAERQAADRALGGVLRAAVGRVRAAKPGTRNNTLFIESARVGGCVAVAGLKPDGPEVGVAAERLAHALGRATPKEWGTVRSGLRSGFSNPTWRGGDVGRVRSAVPPAPLFEGEPGRTTPNLLSLEEARRVVRRTLVERLGLDGESDTARVLLVEASTGVGKTQGLVDALAEQVEARVVVLVDTTAAAQQLAEMLHEAGVDGVGVYLGRSDDPDSPAYCARCEDLELMGEKNRWTAPTLCASCPFGLEAQAQIAEKRGQTEKADRKRARSVEKFGKQAAACDGCRWILHKDEVMQARIVVAAHAAYHPALGEGRIVVVDEAPALTKQITVTLPDLVEWMPVLEEAPTQLLEAAAKLRGMARRTGADRGQLEMEALLAEESARELADAGELFERWRQALVAELAVREDHEAGPELRQIIAEVGRLAHLVQDAAKPWERADVEFGAGPKVPLRAAVDLAWAATHSHALVVSQAGLTGIVPTSVGQELLTGAAMVTVLTATPPPELRTLAAKVVTARTDQGVAVHLFPEQAHGKGGLRDQRRAQREARTVRRWRDAMVDEVGEKPTVISHMKLEQAATDLLDLHHGAATATNAFAGAPVLIVGGHQPPPEVELMQYRMACVVALAGGAPGAAWDPEAAKAAGRGAWGEMVQVAPGLSVRCPVRLPADPNLRRWHLEAQAAHVVQELGRARGAERFAATGERIVVWFAGPPVPLGEHGIMIAAVSETPATVRRSRQQYHSDRKLDTDRRGMLGVAIARREGIVLTGRRRDADTVSALLRRFGLRGIGHDTWRRLVEGGLLDIATPAEIEAALEDLLAGAEARAAEVGVMVSVVAEEAASEVLEEAVAGGEVSDALVAAAVIILAVVAGAIPAPPAAPPAGVSVTLLPTRRSG